MLGWVFRAVEAALGGCGGLIAKRMPIAWKRPPGAWPRRERAPVLLGDEEAGIFYVESWDPAWGEPYFESVGDGPIKVVMSDIFGDDANEEHGDRVRNTFLKFAERDSFTLFTLRVAPAQALRRSIRTKPSSLVRAAIPAWIRL